MKQQTKSETKMLAESRRKKSGKPSRLARLLATTALNECVSYHGSQDVERLACKMQYVLETQKSIRRVQ